MVVSTSYINGHEVLWISEDEYLSSEDNKFHNIKDEPLPTLKREHNSTDAATNYTNSAGVYTGPTSGHVYMGPGTIYVDSTTSPFGTDPVDTPGHPMFNWGLPWGKLYGNLDDAYGRNLPGGRPFLRGQYAFDLVREAEGAGRAYEQRRAAVYAAGERAAAEQAARMTGNGHIYNAPNNLGYPFNGQTFPTPDNPAYSVAVATASDEMLEDSELVASAENQDNMLEDSEFDPSTEDQSVAHDSMDHDVSDLDIANSPAHGDDRQVGDLDIVNSLTYSDIQGVSSPYSSRRARPTPRVSSSGGIAKLNKDGTPRKMRSARGPLCKWNEEDTLKKALIGLVIAANEDGVQLDYAKAAKYIGVTGPAFQQALLKMHKKLAAEGVDLPKITMEWKPKPRSLVVVLKGRFDLE